MTKMSKQREIALNETERAIKEKWKAFFIIFHQKNVSDLHDGCWSHHKTTFLFWVAILIGEETSNAMYHDITSPYLSLVKLFSICWTVIFNTFREKKYEGNFNNVSSAGDRWVLYTKIRRDVGVQKCFLLFLTYSIWISLMGRHMDG